LAEKLTLRSNYVSVLKIHSPVTQAAKNNTAKIRNIASVSKLKNLRPEMFPCRLLSFIALRQELSQRRAEHVGQQVFMKQNEFNR
tara:strand:- start:667 stop:921 length:255 start_codon:yes stop_codon:yes gene_type:complete